MFARVVASQRTVPLCEDGRNAAFLETNAVGEAADNSVEGHVHPRGVEGRFLFSTNEHKHHVDCSTVLRGLKKSIQDTRANLKRFHHRYFESGSSPAGDWPPVSGGGHSLDWDLQCVLGDRLTHSADSSDAPSNTTVKKRI